MSVFSASVFALQYGIPIYSFAQLAVPFVNTGTINILVPQPTLATPDETQVNAPNVDTLYSSAVYDLSQNDVRITVPPVDEDRYWVFAFYDPPSFGDEFAAIGSVNNSTAGDYLLRRSCGDDFGIEQSTGQDGYQGYVDSPTTQGSILIRILVKNNGTDLEYVQDTLESCNATAVPRDETYGAPLSNATFAGILDSNDTTTATLQLLARLNDQNPPFNITDFDYVVGQLQEAGIYGGRYHQPAGLNLTQVQLVVVDEIQNFGLNNLSSLGNGWEHNVPSGLYGSDYVDRTFSAKSGYLEQVADQSLYPGLTDDVMQVSDTEAYIYEFQSKPPVTASGFWSLTLYNSEKFLVANPEDKYSVGDRSNVTYSNGQPVYGSNSSNTTDGTFQVLVQSFVVPPPANWSNNWLPAPSDNSNFSITLRLYGPSEGLSNGDWVYPVVTKVAAIVA
ncbi:hypothetical protein BP6252_10969 [Coleophoma cylindrospora]|uniref:DUF1254 domain-containing protein n=1 Tax=Coleophoma cylindrospora TaxID=1849047 RepID=A0A3D8QPP2_9HELO|nr:hypothetical protein BP6252_10969 [Coleophoma cylindrospora]